MFFFFFFTQNPIIAFQLRWGYTYGTHSGCSEIEGDRSAKTTCADYENFTLAYFLLPLNTHVFQKYIILYIPQIWYFKPYII